jgi:hypothetical protein
MKDWSDQKPPKTRAMRIEFALILTLVVGGFIVGLIV